MRRMATAYPIARACINRRIRQVTQLEWEVTTVDEIENENSYKPQIDLATMFLKRPFGAKSRFREFVTIIIDDLLTLDAVSFEMQKTRGGDFMSLIPVDPATIVLRVKENGMPPEPPETAYAQYLQGRKVAEFTTDELIYDFLNHRSFSPYGLSPFESLILQVESALRGTLYNLNYFRESNVPEGFVTLPDDVAANKDAVEEWQVWFDSMMAGDPRFMHRLKILPGGAEYTPAKKPEDMAFERFEIWLLQQTCAMFDVQPQDIGITYQVNRATGEAQRDIAKERGLYPLANFIKEFLDDIIQEEMGLTNLQFIWRNINPVDKVEEIDVAEREIKLGALSVDEYRLEHGREPVGIGHYIMTGSGPLRAEDFINGVNQNENVDQKPNQKPEEDDEKKKLKEISRWKKCVYTDLLNNKPIREFKSNIIDQEVYEDISNALKGVRSKEQAKYLFAQYLNPEIRTSTKLLQIASDMRKLENAHIGED